jgi:hypothetical protein
LNIKTRINRQVNKFFYSVKLHLIQSLIRIVFSKEKYLYIDSSRTYEYEFLDSLITRSMVETKQMYGDKVSCLFRKEELWDEIIKYFFFIFGNSLLLKSFSKLIINTKSPLLKGVFLFMIMRRY